MCMRREAHACRPPVCFAQLGSLRLLLRGLPDNPLPRALLGRRTSGSKVAWTGCNCRTSFGVPRPHVEVPCVAPAPPGQVARSHNEIVGKPVFEQYIMSLYFAVSLFATIGDPTLSPQTHLEFAITTVFLVSSRRCNDAAWQPHRLH
jgi:hypothetical protein